MNASVCTGTWVDVCAVDDIPLLGSRRVARSRGLPVALFRSGAQVVHALLDRCPHKGGPLSQGIVAADHVACPLHNWAIQFDGGTARAPDAGCTPVFRSRVVDGRVQLDADELASLALDHLPPGAGPCRQR